MEMEVWTQLLLAAALGGVVGLEREYSKKPAGLRTNILICLGSAFFTVLSSELAPQFAGDPTRIASNVVVGIGFIGAGTIIRAGGSVVGLTTAATIFVVASIGMGVGAGHHWQAIAVAIISIVTLNILGILEHKFARSVQSFRYVALVRDPALALDRISGMLREYHLFMDRVDVSREDRHYRMSFLVLTSRKTSEQVMQRILSWGEAGLVDHVELETRNLKT
jgi:putative Mg2+ transporter-C (MgtC) family protein